jgi:hypothetical protein
MESDSFIATLRRVYRRWQEGDGRSGVRMRMRKMTRYRSQLNMLRLMRAQPSGRIVPEEGDRDEEWIRGNRHSHTVQNPS